ncbi:MAG TPA: hypothetical protein DFR83_04425 [Deltaproteobacteria bacterium]|nr:hypothetical protein [Deltaproteobacteria bacterium]
MKCRNVVLVLPLLIGACGASKSTETGSDADGSQTPIDAEPVGDDAVWGDVYQGSDPTVPFLPDGRARYWRYAFERPPAGTALRIDGALQAVRYQAVDVYDDETRTSIGVLRDNELDGALQMWVADERDLAGLDGPALPFPDGRTAIFLRLYDPEDQVPDAVLPMVSLVDLETGEVSAPPARIEPPEIPQAVIDAVVEGQIIEQREDRVDFYRLDDAGLYAAADNDYLVARIVREPGELVVLSFEPPTHATSATDAADVRYWSLTQCDRQSYCHHTVADLEIERFDGRVEMVIGDEDEELRAASGDRTFVPWSTPGEELLLIYRNLATSEGVAHAVDAVPVFDHEQPAEGQEATATLGRRAPSGVRCPRSAFLDGTCAL